MRRLSLFAVVLSAAAAFASAHNNQIVRGFGKLADGRATKIYTLKSRDGLVLEVSNYGGRVVRLYAPDKFGNLADVVLGFNTAAEYEKNGCCVGTLIGRVGNRIRDGRFRLDGKEYQLAVNEKTATRNCNLHSGPEGWDSKLWKTRMLRDAGGEALELTYVSEDGEMGFPGTVKCRVVYRVSPDNVWSIDYEAETDRPTVINPTHHGYWNLAGEASGDVLGQELKIYADRWTRTDEGLIPIGDEPVAGTYFDFTEMHPIGKALAAMSVDRAFAATGGWYDHNFVLRGKVGELKPALRMKDPVSGRVLEVWTTEPCLQVYGSQDFDGTMAAKCAGRTLPRYAGIVFETQHYPDSPNHPEFPSVVLRPGEKFRSHTEYRFLAE